MIIRLRKSFEECTETQPAPGFDVWYDDEMGCYCYTREGRNPMNDPPTCEDELLTEDEAIAATWYHHHTDLLKEAILDALHDGADIYADHHVPGPMTTAWVASAIDVSIEETRRVLDLLAADGKVVRDGKEWRVK